MSNRTRDYAKREDVELIDPVLYNSVSGSAVQDDDTFASASSTKLASSESIKAYVDANASSGGGSSNLPITTTVGSYTHTINAPASLFENSTVTFPKTKDPDAVALVRQTYQADSIVVDFEGDRASQVHNSKTTIIGYHAGNNLTGGANYNTAFGSEALEDTTNGDSNVAIGWYAGHKNTTGSNNISIGVMAHSENLTGHSNVSIGYEANRFNNDGDYNVCIGRNAFKNTSGSGVHNSTILGYNSGNFIRTGDENVVIGVDNTPYYWTSYRNTTIGNKVRCGYTSNVAIGYYSNYSLTSQSDYCTHVGYYSGYDIGGGDYLTGVGGYANQTAITGSYNCSMGWNAYPSSTSSSGQMTLGDYNITNLRCNDTSISGLSDERDKTNITTIPFGLDFINDLKPVTFKWQRRDGSKGTHPEVCGFIAQDLYETEIKHGSTSKTHLVNWDNPDKLETSDMRTYPILVKAVQELSQKIDELQKEIAELKGD